MEETNLKALRVALVEGRKLHQRRINEHRHMLENSPTANIAESHAWVINKHSTIVKAIDERLSEIDGESDEKKASAFRVHVLAHSVGENGRSRYRAISEWELPDISDIRLGKILSVTQKKLMENETVVISAERESSKAVTKLVYENNKWVEM